METWDDDEEDRLEHLQLAKQRGKGAPKKKRSADGESFFPFRLRCQIMAEGMLMRGAQKARSSRGRRSLLLPQGRRRSLNSSESGLAFSA